MDTVLDADYLKTDTNFTRSDALTIVAATGPAYCDRGGSAPTGGQGTIVVNDSLLVIPLHLIKDTSTGSDPTSGAYGKNSECKFQTLLKPHSPVDLLLGDGNAGIADAIATGNLAIIQMRDIALVRLKNEIPEGHALEVPSADIAFRACNGVTFDWPSDVPPPKKDRKSCVSHLLSIVEHHHDGVASGNPMIQTSPILWIKHRGYEGIARSNLNARPGDSGGLDLGPSGPVVLFSVQQGMGGRWRSA
jgi:hypothetical protein